METVVVVVTAAGVASGGDEEVVVEAVEVVLAGRGCWTSGVSAPGF